MSNPPISSLLLFSFGKRHCNEHVSLPEIELWMDQLDTLDIFMCHKNAHNSLSAWMNVFQLLMLSTDNDTCSVISFIHRLECFKNICVFQQLLIKLILVCSFFVLHCFQSAHHFLYYFFRAMCWIFKTIRWGFEFKRFYIVSDE